MLADQMRQHFRIRGGFKDMPQLHQLVFDAVVIFNHAVVNDRNASGLVEMRVRILISGRAVRRPARVANAEAALGRLRLQNLGQTFVNLALFLPDNQIGIDHRYAGAVVTAIFEPPQSF